MQLVLASTSPYRQELLARLRVAFTCVRPNVDETRRVDEAPHSLVERLAIAKAQAVVPLQSPALVIGSDQVAACGDEILTKPQHHAAATAQLTRVSGQRVVFFTGLCVLNTQTGRLQSAVERYTVFFRALTAAQIDNYLSAERPYDCAGSFKAEGLGSALFARLEGDDPTALIGLPLIRLVGMLESEGMNVI